MGNSRVFKLHKYRNVVIISEKLCKRDDSREHYEGDNVSLVLLSGSFDTKPAVCAGSKGMV